MKNVWNQNLSLLIKIFGRKLSRTYKECSKWWYERKYSLKLSVPNTFRVLFTPAIEFQSWVIRYEKVESEDVQLRILCETVENVIRKGVENSVWPVFQD